MIDNIKEYFSDFYTSITKGDRWTRLSLILMGAGYIARGQFVKGILVMLIEIGFFCYTLGFSLQYLMKLSTLGTVQRQEQLDLTTLTKTVNDYDNSLLILLCGIIGLLFIFAFILFYIGNMKNVYRIQVQKENGKHINNFIEDIKSLFGKKFYIVLLSLPSLGVIVINVIPIIFMACIAFTNYDIDHQPPTYLFTWVGLENFKSIVTMGDSTTVTFGYVFLRILIWTIIWALLSTLTSYFGGILLAKFINDKKTKWKKMWRTLFIIAITIPQFVTLLLIGKMFGDYGIVNSFCEKIGLTGFLIKIGVLNAGASCIPFLSSPGWIHVMVILINLWVGIPYQMLSATGILMNIPAEQMESAKIDGASDIQIFWKITMPYMLFVTGPSLITAFIANLNNFNVIYLLTSDYVTANMQFANSNAKEADLLITWLFTLTNDYSNYKIASVIGICVFIICAVLTIISFRKMIYGGREEDFQR